jgi:hypothetical protein
MLQRLAMMANSAGRPVSRTKRAASTYSRIPLVITSLLEKRKVTARPELA